MIWVTGSTGFLGCAVCRVLTAAGRHYVAIPGRKEGVDLRRGMQGRPPAEVSVIHLAYPGAHGIGTMVDTPADLVSDLLRIDLNVIDACAKAKVEKLVCVGSVCAYPEHVTFPTGEDQLWEGYPEAVNAPYGNAKRMQLELLKVYRRQYGLHGIHLILGNLYGPGDRSGHVIPATIRKVLAAKAAGAAEVAVWGDGSASREFLYVEDAARAIVAALDRYDDPAPLNICSGEEILIRSLVDQIMRVCDYQGTIQWDRSKPNGQPRRWFSRARAEEVLGWTPETLFSVGLARTVAWLTAAEGD